MAFTPGRAASAESRLASVCTATPEYTACERYSVRALVAGLAKRDSTTAWARLIAVVWLRAAVLAAVAPRERARPNARDAGVASSSIITSTAVSYTHLRAHE